MAKYKATKVPSRPGVARKLDVEITQEVIDNACVRDSSHCMIADAIKAANPKLRHVSVDLQSIRFTDPDKKARFLYLTPPLAQLALLAFDQGEVVEPFQVRVTRPAKITYARKTEVAVDAITGKPLVDENGKELRVTKVPSGSWKLSSSPGGSIPVVIGGHMPSPGPLTNTPTTRNLRGPAEAQAAESKVLSSRRRRGATRTFGLRLLKP